MWEGGGSTLPITPASFSVHVGRSTTSVLNTFVGVFRSMEKKSKLNRTPSVFSLIKKNINPIFCLKTKPRSQKTDQKNVNNTCVQKVHGISCYWIQPT